MERLEQLPDIPQNAELIAFLREHAAWPDGPDDYALGSWQLHTHPDLIERLRELAPGWPLTAAYGVPLLARDGIAVVVALGTSWLAVRGGHLPADVQTGNPDPAWTFVRDDWHIMCPWQTQLSSADGTRMLHELIASTLAG